MAAITSSLKYQQKEYVRVCVFYIALPAHYETNGMSHLQANHFTADFTIRSVLEIIIVSLYGMLFYLFHKRGQRLINISKVD